MRRREERDRERRRERKREKLFFSCFLSVLLAVKIHTVSRMFNSGRKSFRSQEGEQRAKTARREREARRWKKERKVSLLFISSSIVFFFLSQAMDDASDAAPLLASLRERAAELEAAVRLVRFKNCRSKVSGWERSRGQIDSPLVLIRWPTRKKKHPRSSHPFLFLSLSSFSNPPTTSQNRTRPPASRPGTPRSPSSRPT